MCERSCINFCADSCCVCPNLQVNKPSAYFSHREAGGRYCFSPPIVPPSREPDLQALNNSFMATSKERHALPVPKHSRSQTHATNPTIKDCVPSSTSSTTSALPDADFYKNLDPALWTTRPSDTQSEQSDTSKSSSSDESNGDEQMGWGEARRRHSTHPGKLLLISIQVVLKSHRVFERRATTPISDGDRSSNRL
jgi:hypothetical protein